MTTKCIHPLEQGVMKGKYLDIIGLPAHLHIEAIMVHLPTHILTTHMILVPLVIPTPITLIEIITGNIQGTQSHLPHRLYILEIPQIPLAVQRDLKSQGVKLKRGNQLNYLIVYPK